MIMKITQYRSASVDKNILKSKILISLKLGAERIDAE